MAHTFVPAAALFIGFTMALTAHAGEPSPLRLMAEDERGVATLALDQDAYERLAPAVAVEFDGFVLGAGKAADVSLTRMELFAPDAKFVDRTEAGEVELARPEVQLWRGTVEGEPDSRVFLALTPHGSSGFVQCSHGHFIISSGPSGRWPTVAYDLASPAGAGIQFDMPGCGGGILPEGEQAPASIGEATYEPRVYTCKRYRIAIDCDQEFTANLFGGNAASAQVYATSLLGAVSEIYQRDMNVAMELGYLRTWTTTDPYTQTNNSQQLPQFRSYWNNNMQSVSRNLAHLLSARSLGGGIAYLRAACSSNGYGVSANMTGFFPYPIMHHSASNWDLMVVAHEMGHNLGSGHTHDVNSYNPIIDGCGNNDCSQATSGTIMSYCHLCSGGMSNMRMTFGTRVITAMRTYLDGTANTCGTAFAATSIAQHPAGAALDEGDTLTLTVQHSGQAPTGYRWKKGTAVLTNGARISGATTNSLTISGVLPADAGSYTVELQAPCGVVTSSAAVIEVTECPSFTQHPQNLQATIGQAVSISAYSTGAFPRTYQWFKNGAMLNNTGRITGATNFTLNFNPVQEGDQGSYTLVVSNVCGSRTSQPAVLTVIAPACGTADFNGDGDIGTDADIEAFFACIGGNCCPSCYAGGADFNADGDTGTDADIESFFRVLGGGNC